MGLEARLEKSTAKALYQILDGIALFGLSYEVMAINYLATKEMIEVIPVGGYSEVGKNMTAIKIDDEILILDMGLYIPKVVSFDEE